MSSVKRPSPALVCRAPLRSWARLWGQPSIARLSVSENSRLRSTLARWRVGSHLIEVSHRVRRYGHLTPAEIACHEAAHVVVWERHGRSARPHGPEWAALMKAAGFEPKATAIRCGERARRARTGAIFRHFCPVCHFSKRAKRIMQRWRCPECRAIGLEGKLKVERVTR